MDCGQMRDFSEFCEQLQEIRLKFHKWDSCERTVALYYLMAGLPFANAKFLQHALEQCIFAANTQEAQTLERKANDPTFINSFLAEHPQIALSLILTHLPLLRPGNSDGAKCYLKAIRKVLTEFITPPYKIYNECVEIMSYVFIHPAFNKEDKKSFKHLLKQVLHRVSPDNFIHSPVNESSDESVSPNPEPYVFNDRFDRRSNSLTAQASSQENLENLKPSHKPRSYSLSSEKSLLTTAPLQLSSSETRLQDLQMLNNQPEMKGIIAWLKSLRLHKYSWVFNNLTYEQMLNLNEEALQAIGITKGARHKILLSISKLKERSSLLTELETEVMNGADLNVALKKLKGVLQSPLQLNCEEDLPTQFVKVMGKVCTQLLMLRQPSDESFVLFNSLCDRAESLEAFSDEQKRRLIMWKGQLTNGAKLPIYRHQNSSSQGGTNSTFSSKPLMPILTPKYAQKSSSFPNMQNAPKLNDHRHSIGSVNLKGQLFSLPQSSIFKGDASYQYKCNNGGSTQFHVRFQEGEKFEKQPISNVDIESSLESLCLQMMEHALGP